MLDLSLLGRLEFRHAAPTRPPLPPGRHDLGLFAERDYVLIVPEGIDPAHPTPLMVLFHGGGGSAEKILPILHRHALERGFLLLVPQSLFPTWDIVIAGNGPDRERLDIGLREVASRFALDPAHVAFAGHSDGGSYSLSTGLSNGQIVTHILAFSAGFMTVLAQEGAPKVFIAHGQADTQTPIDSAGRAHAAKLRGAGYELTYVEHPGPHASQPAMVQLGVDHFLKDLRQA
ncbi:putative esterase [Angulomicrobium tetraedrale]|uniref:Putative esterase n=1 Tax=Ancylobacter tetraedralis TaxID=217068 RepID=A0A839Z8I9_9HYPH|nr:esterase [Ancylobacter tetraedralis]MBB3771230.1 putative esterase [Ancylobacter tetraedralis]